MDTHLGDDLGFQVKQPRGGAFPDGHGSIREGLLGPRLSVLRSLLAAPAYGVRQLCARYSSLQRKCILLLPQNMMHPPGPAGFFSNHALLSR